jgi:hypothetical protein
MKKFDNYHYIVLTVILIIEEYIQDKIRKLGMLFFFG